MFFPLKATLIKKRRSTINATEKVKLLTAMLNFCIKVKRTPTFIYITTGSSIIPFAVDKGSTTPNISNNPAVNTETDVIMPKAAKGLGTRLVLRNN